MRRARRTDQNRPDGKRIGHNLDHLIGDVGRVDVRHDQHVCLAGQPRVRIDAIAERRQQSRFAVHVAIDLEFGRLRQNEIERRAHLVPRFAFVAAEIGP